MRRLIFLKTKIILLDIIFEFENFILPRFSKRTCKCLLLEIVHSISTVGLISLHTGVLHEPTAMLQGPTGVLHGLPGVLEGPTVWYYRGLLCGITGAYWGVTGAIEDPKRVPQWNPCP